MSLLIKTIIPLSVLLFIVPGKLFAQSNLVINKIGDSGLATRNYYPLSPTASSLGIFGQTAVSYYSGSPIISVPLGSVKYKEIEVPISLSYQNTGGNKPDVIPGLTGNGWLFSCGGAITIISRGIAPADAIQSQSVQVLPYATNGSNWKDSATLADEMLKRKFPYDYNGKRYDEFAYNFCGSSGSFYSDYPDTAFNPLTPTQHIRTIQGEDLYIQKIITGYKIISLPNEPQDGTNHFSAWDSGTVSGPAPGYYRNSIIQNTMTYGFIVTDSRGVKYTFGNADASIEFTRNGLPPSSYDIYNQNTIASTWYLTSIQSPNGAVVKFVYKRGPFYTVATAAVKGLVIIPGFFATVNQLPYSVILSATLYNPTYLDSIITPISTTKFYWTTANQQLSYSILHPYTGDTANSASLYTFDPYPDVSNATGMDKRFSNKLDSFSIFTKDGVKNKKVSFVYTSDTTTRLKLMWVQMQGSSIADGSQKYQFEYDSLALPPYRAFKTDKYGYYDGRPPAINITTNSSYYNTLLADTNQRKAYLASREPDTNYTRAEILRKIIYPTGGYSYFEYENNKYGRIASNWPATIVENLADSITGGLRIKSITDYDFANHIAGKKRYFYCKNYAAGGRSSSGVLNFKPIFYTQYNGPISAPHISRYINDPSYNGVTMTVKQFSTDPLYPASSIKGNFIGYSEVAEVNADNSYTVFKFKNYDNGYQDKSAENIYVDNPQIGNSWQEDDVNSLGIERGQMLSQSKYDSAGILRFKTVYAYNDTVTRFNNNVRVLKAIPNPAFSANFPTLRYLAYLVYTYYPFLKRETKYQYTTPTDSIVTTTNYTYDDNYRNLVQQSTIESDSSIRTTISRYPADMIVLGQTNPYQSMVARHQISQVIEKEDQLNGTKIYKEINSYAKGLADDTSLILPSTISTQYRGRAAEIRMKYSRYDSLGNLLSFSRPGGVSTSYVWGYARSFPVAKIVNAAYDSVLSALANNININSFSSQSSPDVSSLSGLLRNSTSLPGSMITTYEYNPLIGLTKETDPKKMSTSYAYDLLGRLSTIRDNNGAVVKQYCYDYAGQSEHCFVNSDVQAYQYYWSIDHTAICDVANHQSSVALVNLYTFAPTFSPYAPQFTEFFSDVQLSQRPTDGYYVYKNSFVPGGFPGNFYVSGGRIFYTGICSGGIPPFSLRYTDSIRKNDICDSAYPTKYVYTVNNDTPSIGKTLYNTYQLTTPVPDGYYLYNKMVYHSKNGVVDSALLCSVLYPPQPTWHSFSGKVQTSVSGICFFSIGFLLWFRSVSSTVSIGDTLYYDPSATSSVGAGYVSDKVKIYTTNSNGVVTAINPCF